MFDKFGELNSCAEINELAENLFNEGDLESIKVMAKENGIQEEVVEMYLQGEVPALCDTLTAAVGKVEVEAEELKPKEILEDWVQYIIGQCIKDELMAAYVRKKGKSLKGCIAALLSWSFKNCYEIDKDIIAETGILSGKIPMPKAGKGSSRQAITMGIPGMGRAKKIIREYYMGGERK
nr:MAG TPA: PcfK-like protein [Caudoviricetes sp.]